ncbi:MAG: peptidoglycan recognition protein family protein [Bryobacteraceae bacterium]|nr:peptidoglycan recognition protein family protein [Bryobacteraceae bacterium]MDW8379157.1 peptidoglycan recognition family protein [Bryobacterales bacterium]
MVLFLGFALVTLGWTLSPPVGRFRELTGATAPPLEVLRPEARGVLRPPEVWLVETKTSYEIYSNGLRIETHGAVHEAPRKYFLIPKPESPDDNPMSHLPWRTETAPAGIVYHTTESHIAPFRSTETQTLQRLAQGVLSYVRQARSYHYLIDRFGRVHRVVDEKSIAHHSGWSVWADARHIYLNLNDSFLGVAFEAQTTPQDGSESINPAQVRAGQMITEMLRSKYQIPAENCVTHAQVSVNPDNFLVGAHTDWAQRFPFAAFGLPDNYSIPLPSITLFGFQYDNLYWRMSEASLWKSLLWANEQLRQSAAQRGVRLPAYRAILNRRYLELLEVSRKQKTEEGNQR